LAIVGFLYIRSNVPEGIIKRGGNLSSKRSGGFQIHPYGISEDLAPAKAAVQKYLKTLDIMADRWKKDLPLVNRGL